MSVLLLSGSESRNMDNSVFDYIEENLPYVVYCNDDKVSRILILINFFCDQNVDMLKIFESGLDILDKENSQITIYNGMI